MPLKDKQQAFVREYLIDLNATAAARRAGYKQPNKQGPRLLVNVGIQEAIQAEKAKRSERTGITPDWVLEQLKDVAQDSESDSARVAALRLLGQHLGLFEGAELIREIAELKKKIHEAIATRSGTIAAAAGRPSEADHANPAAA